MPAQDTKKEMHIKHVFSLIEDYKKHRQEDNFKKLLAALHHPLINKNELNQFELSKIIKPKHIELLDREKERDKEIAEIMIYPLLEKYKQGRELHYSGQQEDFEKLSILFKLVSFKEMGESFVNKLSQRGLLSEKEKEELILYIELIDNNFNATLPSQDETDIFLSAIEDKINTLPPPEEYKKIRSFLDEGNKFFEDKNKEDIRDKKIESSEKKEASSLHQYAIRRLDKYTNDPTLHNVEKLYLALKKTLISASYIDLTVIKEEHIAFLGKGDSANKIPQNTKIAEIMIDQLSQKYDKDPKLETFNKLLTVKRTFPLIDINDFTCSQKTKSALENAFLEAKKQPESFTSAPSSKRQSVLPRFSSMSHPQKSHGNFIDNDEISLESNLFEEGVLPENAAIADQSGLESLKKTNSQEKIAVNLITALQALREENTDKDPNPYVAAANAYRNYCNAHSSSAEKTQYKKDLKIVFNAVYKKLYSAKAAPNYEVIKKELHKALAFVDEENKLLKQSDKIEHKKNTVANDIRNELYLLRRQGKTVNLYQAGVNAYWQFCQKKPNATQREAYKNEILKLCAKKIRPEMEKHLTEKVDSRLGDSRKSTSPPPLLPFPSSRKTHR